jgi:hypothetical protein
MELLIIAAACLSVCPFVNLWYTRRETQTLWACLIALMNNDSERKPRQELSEDQTILKGAEKLNHNEDGIRDIGVEHPSAKGHSIDLSIIEQPTKGTGLSVSTVRTAEDATPENVPANRDKLFDHIWEIAERIDATPGPLGYYGSPQQPMKFPKPLNDRERLVVDRAELFITVALYGPSTDFPRAFQLLKDALERAGRKID